MFNSVDLPVEFDIKEVTDGSWMVEAVCNPTTIEEASDEYSVLFTVHNELDDDLVKILRRIKATRAFCSFLLENLLVWLKYYTDVDEDTRVYECEVIKGRLDLKAVVDIDDIETVLSFLFNGKLPNVRHTMLSLEDTINSYYDSYSDTPEVREQTKKLYMESRANDTTHRELLGEVITFYKEAIRNSNAGLLHMEFSRVTQYQIDELMDSIRELLD